MAEPVLPPPATGNPMLKGLLEVPPPDPVPWWPMAPGWQALAVLLLVVLLVHGWRRWQRWRRDRLRRECLAQLAAVQRALSGADPEWRSQLQRVPALLKTLAVQQATSGDVQSLTGSPWVAHLNTTSAGTLFAEEETACLQAVAWQHPDTWGFQPAQAATLVQAADRWMRHV